MRYTVSNYTPFETVPGDVYTAHFERFEIKPMEYGDTAVMTFTIEGGDYDGSEVQGLCSVPPEDKGLTPKCKMRRWMQALLGRELEEGEEIGLEDCMGKRCRLNVTIETKADNLTGKPVEFNRIESVLSIPKPKPKPGQVTKPAPKPRPKVEEEEEEDLSF